MSRSFCFWFISLIACTGLPHARDTILIYMWQETQFLYICDIDLLVVRHTSKKLLALLNHSFLGVHVAGRKQLVTSWGVHITSRNWEFSSAVEKLNRRCLGTERYHHKRGHTGNIVLNTEKMQLSASHFNNGERQLHQMARQMLGDFYMNIQSPPSHIRWSQFQQGLVQEIIQQFSPTQIVLFELPGEISTPNWRVLVIKRSIKELQALTNFTDFIIVHSVQWAQCRNLRGRWIQAT